jgi:hypothetical protein
VADILQVNTVKIFVPGISTKVEFKRSKVPKPYHVFLTLKNIYPQNKKLIALLTENYDRV